MTPEQLLAQSSTGAKIDLPEGIEPNLNELFERNPLDWSENDLHAVVIHMRRAREIFKTEDVDAKKAGRRVNVKKANQKALPVDPESLSLSNLGL